MHGNHDTGQQKRSLGLPSVPWSWDGLWALWPGYRSTVERTARVDVSLDYSVTFFVR